MITCEDCGSRVYEGFCTNCNEEHFIADQYRQDGESVPQAIADLESEKGQVSNAIDQVYMKRRANA